MARALVLAAAAALSLAALSVPAIDERLGDASRTFVAGLPWIAAAGFPERPDAARGLAGALAVLLLALPALALGARIDQLRGAEVAGTARDLALVLLAVGLLALAAAGSARPRLVAHLWLALVLAAPVLHGALVAGGATAYGAGPAGLGWLARASPLGWAWLGAERPLGAIDALPMLALAAALAFLGWAGGRRAEPAEART